MILVVDLGNSDVVFGVYDEHGQLKAGFRSPSLRYKSVAEYVSTIKELLFLKGIDAKQLTGSIVSSVVPQLTAVLMNAVKVLVGTKPILLAPGVKTGLAIHTDNPNEVGSDLIAGAIGAVRKYGYPCVVVDLGTATKVYMIDKKCNYIGGIITPGVKVASASLIKIAAQLPEISLEAPAKVIGTNTVDSMNSGVVYGHASMVDGFIRRFLREAGYDAKIIATGGLAGTIIPYCETPNIIIDKTLILDGLYDIYLKNKTVATSNGGK